MVFGEVVGHVVTAPSPVYKELALFDSVLNPVETHVDCFGSLLFDCVVDDAGRTCVVCLNGGWGLRVSHFLECGAEFGAFFCIEEQSSHFGFCC